MRVTMGIVGLLGLGVTVAVAQQPPATSLPQRTAKLLAPQPLSPGDARPVARASSEGLPTFVDSTPVTRANAKLAGGPAWLNGTDPGVRPASGTVSNKPAVRQLAQPTAMPRDEPSFITKGFDKLKSALGPTPAPGPFPNPPAESMNPNASFRGTTASGAPVYAGAPAYRWYGWGSVTPGANPYAPTGQYPRASANWYSITGATPGAFPVPVMNPLRPAPGTEPPVYVATPAPRTPPPVLPAQGTHGYPASTGTAQPFNPPPPDFSKPATATDNNVPQPTIAAPPTIPEPPLVVSPPPIVAPVSVPTLAPVPLPPPTIPTEPMTVIPTSERPQPVSNVPPAMTPTPDPVPPAPLPAFRGVGDNKGDVHTPDPAPPAPLPVSVIDDQPNWQPTSQKPGVGQWAPTGKPAGAPQSSTPAARPTTVARGQMDDNRPDPVATLIRKLCEGRATGVDVRWTGSKKLTVCFECATSPVAQQLVKDISARPELGPLQIDFCVLVK